MIFWTVIGSWTGAWYYDRHQKKKIQQKWATMVKHLADEPIEMNALPRKLTVFLAAPPVDNILTAREHFHEYVKPILAAAGVDWEAVEGRMQGDVRAQLADRIRKLRKVRGEPCQTPLDPDDPEIFLANERARMGVTKSTEVGGDIVIGRNTWKEYVRGLHEGWLGPLDPPKIPLEPAQDSGLEGSLIEDVKPPSDVPSDIGAIPTYAAEKVIEKATKASGDLLQDETQPISEPSETAAPDSATEPNAGSESKQDDKPKKPKQPAAFNTVGDYTSASLPPAIPTEFVPSTIIPLPHLLGIRNTPIRMYRFLTRRYLAEEVGESIAAAVLASSYRPYSHLEETTAPSAFIADDGSPTSSSFADEGKPEPPRDWEQQRLLEPEESEWHKSVRKERDPQKESVWLDPMVIDSRIGSRMRRFELTQANENSEALKSDES